MSKINAVRLVNLNYNNNSIRISDEIFWLNGESTLLSLRNGGGKSVLVQMMMAPFVHKRYQNAKDRPFASYFTTNKPTFIMVEWKLDHGAGYALTGMMVRKNQEISEERQEELEAVNFIAEYKERCGYDIVHLPVVEKTDKEVTLKGFHGCLQLFESYKRERGAAFSYYDMNYAAQSKQYFQKLTECRIYYKEWETIIKKVNLKESGLSDLFADCKDEKGLVEKWFLEAVENKLNKEQNRMAQFQGIMEKYTGQYKDNKSKIERRDTIRLFGQEAERIRTCAVHYEESSKAVEGQEGRIADFIRRLHEMEEKERENAAAVLKRMEELAEQLGRLEYERLSEEIHKIADKERFASSNLEMLRMEEEELERVREEIAKALHVLACVKLQENAAECREERDREWQKLLLCRQKEENLEPERKRLGVQLKRYYEALYAGKQEEKENCASAVREMEEEQEKGQEKLEGLRQEQTRLEGQAGGLTAAIQAYDKEEDRFNEEYKENRHRNILGEYEAGELQIRQAEYEKEMDNSVRARTRAKKEAEQCKEQRKGLQRLLEDKAAGKIRLESEQKEAKRLLEEYGQELEKRQTILAYFEIGQEDLFDTEKILAAASRKLAEVDLARQGLEKEADSLEKEYRRLAQGQVLELSDEFRAMLEEAGLHFVYGMEWLLKNSLTKERNKELVEGHPFLPYSIILSQKELERLSGLPEQVYTSFPVPVMIREELEKKGTGGKGAVRKFENLSFYLWFNDNLLDEEKLRQMLEEQEGRIRKLQKSIERKKEEYAQYIGKREKISSQKVSKPAYEAAQEDIRRLGAQMEAQEREILGKREEMETLEKLQAQREWQIGELEQEIACQNRRLADFARLCQSYAEYRENCRLLEKNRKEKERTLNLQKLSKEKLGKLEQGLATEKNRLAALERELEECAGKKARYRQYPSAFGAGKGMAAGKEGALQGAGEGVAAGKENIAAGAGMSAEEAKEAEARYEAITAGVSAQQKELEARTEAAEKRYRRALEEWGLLKEKHRLTEADWEGVRYDRKEETHQEIRLEEQERKLRRKKELIHEEEIQCALLGQEKEGKMAQMKERCGKEEPVAKARIRTIDFADAIRKLEYEKENAQKEVKRLQKKIQDYENSLTALAEYEEFAWSGPVEWECSLEAMAGVELARQKGILVRDYNACVEQCREAKAGLERTLNQIVRMEQFADEFYRKPLEAMLQLTEDAQRVLKQLDTTVASYHSLMEKLLVDISLVEKEKAKIVELVGDYLKEVHDNLNKIDRNSTIVIRERAVKMLKMELPDWTENESLFRLRLQDYVDDITGKGIALLEENKNVQEYLGAKITTRALYDAVVGIGNVQIRLYKIEAQREYPIAWADVARNSGGEGFLSAFVVLSALLYYMRKDDSDIFADRNEGKVLLMDNPFAQTNASHLLKPLMDMAKKTNTQLICLSGLSGESIYNRFDNIYVLTLIAANLRGGMQYLNADHMRGSEEEVALASRIEVTQQELVF